MKGSNEKDKSYVASKRNTTGNWDTVLNDEKKRSFQLKDSKPLVESKQTKAESLGCQMIIEGKSPTA